MYHLYEHYGFSVRDIGRLFIMGFGSSAVFGTLAGAMADYRWGGWGAHMCTTGRGTFAIGMRGSDSITECPVKRQQTHGMQWQQQEQQHVAAASNGQ